MALVTQLLRRSRFEEIAGCPLCRPRPGANEAACKGCRYNALAPKSARIGCVISTPYEAYQRALDRFAQISPADAARFVALLDASRRGGEEEPIAADALVELNAITERWWKLAGNDAAEREVISTLVRFTRLAIETHEPVRLVS